MFKNLKIKNWARGATFATRFAIIIAIVLIGAAFGARKAEAGCVGTLNCSAWNNDGGSCTSVSSPVSFWHLDETSSGSYADSVGSNTMSCIGTCPTPTPSGYTGHNGAQTFGGPISAASSPSLQGMSAITVSAWFNSPNASFNSGFVSKWRAYQSDHMWVLNYNGSDFYFNFDVDTCSNIAIYLDGGLIGSNTNNTTLGAPASVSANAWYNVVGTASGCTNLGTNSYSVAIGAIDDGGKYAFNGKIDEVGIWNVALSSGQVAALYNNGLTGSGAGTSVCDWTASGACNTNDACSYDNGSDDYTGCGSDGNCSWTDTGSSCLGSADSFCATFNNEGESICNDNNCDYNNSNGNCVNPCNKWNQSDCNAASPQCYWNGSACADYCNQFSDSFDSCSSEDDNNGYGCFWNWSGSCNNSQNCSYGNSSDCWSAGCSWATGSSGSCTNKGGAACSSFTDSTSCNDASAAGCSWSGAGGSSSTLTQAAYKWFVNTNSTAVGRGAITNQPDTAPTQGNPFRLRLLLSDGTASLAQNATSSVLQYAVRSGTCDTAFSGESYANVTTNSGAIRYYDNSGATDGAALTASYEDPKLASSTPGVGYDTVDNQTYNEDNTNFSNSQSAINTGEDGLWDFSLVDYSAPPLTTYCFRAVQAGGGLLDSYKVIPQITTAQPMKIKLRGNVKLRQVKFH